MRVFVFFALLSFVFSISSQADQPPIQVGVALRFAPDLNSFAGSIFEGIEYAKDVFEAGHPGLSLELVKYAHKNGHASVDDAAKKILDDHVKFVIGGEMSDEAFALAESFHDKGVLLMTPTASNPLLTAGNPLVFRACFSDDQVAAQITKYVESLKQIHSIGVIHNTSNAYTDYLTSAFLDDFAAKNSQGVKVTEFRFAGEQPDFNGAVKQFKNAGVDLVIAFTLQEQLKSFYQLASHANLHPLYVGGDGWGTNDSLRKWIGNDFKGIRDAYWVEDSKDAQVTAFKAGFEKKNQKSPDAWTAVAYDAAMTLFEAIAKSKNHQDAASVAETLHSTTFPKGVTARELKFNNKNTLIKPLYLYEISKTGTQYVKELK